MAATIPSALKSADITRFATRAAQVEKAKPAVAYWCNYWIVNQIISKDLHNTDEECQTYTMALMDKLEQTKAENPENDAILNDMAGQACVEQFGLETFQRAENAVRANKASRQTADTFQAAATFLELSHTWGPLDPDIASKVKFAKYHALRIAKALRAGVDPNLSNPTPEPSPTQEEPPLDPNDPEVQALNDPVSSPIGAFNSSYQPSVEDVVDEHDHVQHRMAYNSVVDQSLHPSRDTSVSRSFKPIDLTGGSIQPSENTSAEDYYQTVTNKEADVSSPTDRAASIGGGYFSNVPDGYADTQSPAIPGSLPSPDISPEIDLPDPSTLPPPTSTPMSNGGPQTRGLPPPHVNFASAPQYTPHVRHPNKHFPHNPPNHSNYPSSSPAFPSPPPSIPTSAQAIPPSRTRPATRPTQESFTADDEAIAKAQKHARWAISALNFEDVNSAVKDLRLALQSLGAS